MQISPNDDPQEPEKLPDHIKKDIETQLDRLRQTRLRIMASSPFFSTLAMELKFRIIHTDEVTEYLIFPDGKLFLNLDYLKSKTKKQLDAVLIHNVMHPALMFFQRLGTRDIDLATLAHDLVLNNFVQQAKYEIPDDFMIAPEFQEHAWEEVYEILKQAATPQLPLPGQGGDGDEDGEGTPPLTGDATPDELQAAREALKKAAEHFHSHVSTDTTGTTKEVLDAQWRQTLAGARQAQQRSKKGWGSLPAGLRQMIDEVLEPKLDWRKILSRFIGEKINREDYSYRRVNRRNQNSDIMLPALHGTRADVAIVVDTSGSMTGEPLKEIMGEVAEVVEELRSTSIFLSCDAQVHNELHEPDQLDLILDNLDGGGGSDFRPAFDKLEELNFRGPAIFATDGWISTPEECPPGIDVLWLMPTYSAEEPPAPYGEELRIPMDDNEGKKGRYAWQ